MTVQNGKRFYHDTHDGSKYFYAASTPERHISTHNRKFHEYHNVRLFASMFIVSLQNQLTLHLQVHGHRQCTWWHHQQSHTTKHKLALLNGKVALPDGKVTLPDGMTCIITMTYYHFPYLRFFRFFFAADDCVFAAVLLAELPAPGEGKNGAENESDFLRSAAAAALIPANIELNSSSSSASLQRHFNYTTRTLGHSYNRSFGISRNTFICRQVNHLGMWPTTRSTQPSTLCGAVTSISFRAE